MSQNLQIKRGDTSTYTLTVTQGGAAFNLTGSTIRFTAKYAPTDADGSAVFTRTSPATGIAITDAPGGIASITISPANTSTLAGVPISIFYDVQVTDGSGNVYTVVDGVLTVNPDISVTTP